MERASIFEIIPNVNPHSAEGRTALLAEPGFGKIFTDHMVTIEWSEDIGWHKARVRARAPFTLDPASPAQ